MNNENTSMSSTVTDYTGKVVVVSWGRFGQELKQFKEFILRFDLFHPGQSAISNVVSVHVVTDVSLANKKFNTDSWFVKRNVIQDELRKKAEESLDFIANTSGRSTPQRVFRDFHSILDLLISRLDKIHPDEKSWGLVFYNLRQIFDIILYTIMTTGSAPSLGWSFFQVLCRGYIPIRWMGNWPDGYCIAYCPPDVPQATVPPECQPTPEQLAAGGDGKKKRPAKPAALPTPVFPVVPVSTWSAVASAPDHAAAFREYFASFATTEACRVVLDRVSRLVRDIVVGDQQLVFDFATDDLGQHWRLVCEPPYTGSLAGLPPSVAMVVRRHNGMALFRNREPTVEWYPYRRGRFDMEWDLRWTPDPEDPNELFRKPPLVPLTDGDDIWLLHPLTRIADGEPAVVWMNHSNANLSEPLPFTAGGIFLRLLLKPLIGSADDGGALDAAQGK